jgi:hypothetical protein
VQDNVTNCINKSNELDCPNLLYLFPKTNQMNFVETSNTV